MRGSGACSASRPTSDPAVRDGWSDPLMFAGGADGRDGDYTSGMMPRVCIVGSTDSS